MKLKPPKGCDAVSIGGKTYTLNPDGLIDVPEEAAATLMQSHGFTLPLRPKSDTDKPEAKPPGRSARGEAASNAAAMPPSKGRGRSVGNAVRRSKE